MWPRVRNGPGDAVQKERQPHPRPIGTIGISGHEIALSHVET
jgi:hypothetical protein